MSRLLDTSVVIAADLDGLDDSDATWAISAITVGELEAGVLLARRKPVRAERLRRLSALLAVAPVLPLDAAVAARYGELRAAASRQPSNDLWIAATALHHEAELWTHDADFDNVPGLAVVKL